MRLVQLSRHSIAFPSPEGALREPNGLLAVPSVQVTRSSRYFAA